jgi:hypothetical protein
LAYIVELFRAASQDVTDAFTKSLLMFALRLSDGNKGRAYRNPLSILGEGVGGEEKIASTIFKWVAATFSPPR